MLTSPQSPLSAAFSSLALVSSPIDPPSPQALRTSRAHAEADTSRTPRFQWFLIRSPCVVLSLMSFASSVSELCHSPCRSLPDLALQRRARPEQGAGPRAGLPARAGLLGRCGPADPVDHHA